MHPLKFSFFPKFVIVFIHAIIRYRAQSSRDGDYDVAAAFIAIRVLIFKVQ